MFLSYRITIVEFLGVVRDAFEISLKILLKLVLHDRVCFSFGVRFILFPFINKPYLHITVSITETDMRFMMSVKPL